MIKAVIFDFDHTLYDRRLTLLASVEELMDRLKEYLRPDVTKEEFTEALLYAEMAPEGYYGNGYQGVRDLLDQKGVFAEAPDKSTYALDFYHAMSHHIVLFEDTYSTLQTLRDIGYKVALLTNGITEMQTKKLSDTRVPEYMDEIIISDSLGQQKPHPKTFFAICRKLGIKTSEAVYVGDNIICDICGARGAGMKTIWFPFVNNWPDDVTPPDFTIQSLSEIPEIVKSL